MNCKIGVGLYGGNGHQVSALLVDCPLGEVVGHAAGAVPADGGFRHATHHPSLAALLRDPRVALVSLCSPRRADQAADAIACLRAGKHVYAEKPAAFSDPTLDEILAVAEESGREFHEMADTIFRQPWHALGQLVRAGRLGDIVQVWAQKSYPSHFEHRPQDEDIDGGITRQCAIHAVRMVEHLTGVQVSEVQAVESQLGLRQTGALRTATSLLLTLENGGVGSVVANYLNPPGFGRRGNDQVRLFGTLGMAEITDDAQRSRVIIGGDDLGPIDASAPVEPYLHSYLKHLLGIGALPLTLEAEFHPLRVVNRAKLNADRCASGCQPVKS